MTEGVVIAVKQPMKLLVKRFVRRKEWPQYESFEEPRCMSLMPLHGAVFGTRLYHLVFGREIVNQNVCQRPYRFVLRVERGRFLLQFSGPRQQDQLKHFGPSRITNRVSASTHLGPDIHKQATS